MTYRCPSTHVVENPSALLDPAIGKAFGSGPVTIGCKDPDEAHVEHFGTVIPFPGFAETVVRWLDPPAPRATVAVRSLPLSEESRALLLLEAIARAVCVGAATEIALRAALEALDAIRDVEVEGS